MITNFKKGKFTDVLFGVVAPTLVALLIVGIALLSTPELIGLKYPLLEAIVVVGVPMLIGMIWNQWAGGSSGFLLGGLYVLYYSDQLYAAQGSADISLLGNLVSAMLIGYISGALSKRSDSYRKMLIAAVTAGIMGTLIILLANQFSTIVGNPGIGGAVLVLLPRILAGILVPLVARAFLRHGTRMNKLTMDSKVSGH
jgi:hypothetical protein